MRYEEAVAIPARKKGTVHYGSSDRFRKRATCLSTGSILHLDQSFGQKFLEKTNQVARAPFRLDVIFVCDRTLYLGDWARLLHQVPNSRADRIETIINAALDIQNRSFPGKIAGYLILGDHDDGTI